MPQIDTPFEAPAGGPLVDGAVPRSRRKERVLAASQIQGNIFPGFNKDHQTLLFLRIEEPTAFRGWLANFVNQIATTEFVLAFNRLFKSLKNEQKQESGQLRATWTNIAFSFGGLKKLGTSAMKLSAFVDTAFKEGLLARSQAGELGDPVGSKTAGDPENWLIGGPGREADVILIVAADRRSDLNEEISRIVSTLFMHANESGKSISSGASILFRQDGDTLMGPLTGHEHFGFRDGISQPGIRGLLPDGTPLTPSQNPLDPNQGKPGQDLLWPGEFVFGYPGQDAKKDVAKPGDDPLENPRRKAPEFARNGSFLVFRRLRQDVGNFHRFLSQVAARFQVTSEFVGAKMVGRWTSGAPAVVSPQNDNLDLAKDECQNNNFEFQESEEEPSKLVDLPGKVCQDVTPPANDPTGAKAPFAAHIRKAYPRNDVSPTIPELGESSTQTHRLLRRGIPYGEQSASTTTTPVDDAVDRGLLFLAYQTSIVEQFEFVTAAWANNPDFKEDGVGFDPIIGQNGNDPSRRRSFRLNLPGETQPIETDQDWVIPTGGGYFFAPSIAALQMLAGEKTNSPAKKPSASKTKRQPKSRKKRRKSKK